jgi:hypothetical protein
VDSTPAVDGFLSLTSRFPYALAGLFGKRTMGLDADWATSWTIRATTLSITEQLRTSRKTLTIILVKKKYEIYDIKIITLNSYSK